MLKHDEAGRVKVDLVTVKEQDMYDSQASKASKTFHNTTVGSDRVVLAQTPPGVAH